MGDLTAEQFGDFFHAVHDCHPYPWQSRLARQVLQEGWPDVIDLPTGVGKTAVLDVAVFALAARPDASPRRIVFVIDRRIVVDQVYKHAQRISDAVATANGGVLATMKARLGELSDGEPLGLSALRGGIPLEGAWPSRPDQPWVMVSTVDQFGSRLLFRGYGVSDRSRPIHAGLAGNDCLVILDEVHLSRAFARTLTEATSDAAIPMMRSLDGGLPRRFKVLEMSATPETTDFRFGLSPEDIVASEALSEIVEAKKSARLLEIKGKPHVAVPRKVLEIIKNDLQDDERSVGVIVNRVQTAREACQALLDKGFDAHLITGRMRPIDRQLVMDKIAKCVAPDRKQPLEKRTVVVATQAIEVGADFSFDALISEIAPIDSLVQRLGRLDRRGTLSAHRDGPARCWILGTEGKKPAVHLVGEDCPEGPEGKAKDADPVYGTALRCSWTELQALVAEGGEVDVSPERRLLDSVPSCARAPTAQAPLLLPTHINAWTQTNPQPVADPPIAEFLHGKEREQQPDVTVIWRWDRRAEALSLVPPRQAEFLSVPISGVRSWLADEEEVLVTDLDLARGDDRTSIRRASRSTERRSRLASVVRWNRSDSNPVEVLNEVGQIKPGDVLIADPRIGGLRNGTWDPSAADADARNEGRLAGNAEAQAANPFQDDQATAISDLGDQAQLAHRIRVTLRLDPRLFTGVPMAGRLALPVPRDEQDALSSRREIIEEWLGAVAESFEPLPAWLSDIVTRLRSDTRRFGIEVVDRDSDADEPYYVLVERAVDPTILDESEDAPSGTGTEATLSSHLAGVGNRAASYAERLGLSPGAVADFRLAGELHDLGKIDTRFQAQMAGHDPVRMATLDEPLAKSVRNARPRRGAWPPVRHEFSSVALAQSAEALLRLANDADLVLHLVGTHHGFGRPLPAIRADDEPQWMTATGQISDGCFRLRPRTGAASETDGSETDRSVACSNFDTKEASDGRDVAMAACSDLGATPVALEMADRFWRLQERYGHHGLAWLEAIFRLADWQQSKIEEVGRV